MASPVSSTPSAAPATSSAPRSGGVAPRGDGLGRRARRRLSRLPIRWKLAGTTAGLTLVILALFATLVGALTTRRVQRDFDRQVQAAATDLASRVKASYDYIDSTLDIQTPPLDVYARASNGGVIRVYRFDLRLHRASSGAPFLGRPNFEERTDFGGYRVENRAVKVANLEDGYVYVQYGRRIADVQATKARVRVLLGIGVLGGTALALLAGLAIARRAIDPIARLTAAARDIERTRDPALRIPQPPGEDEVTELARTLQGMLAALDDARSETEQMLLRQREFVADASHELRTPLTSVLANLELLEEVLDGEPREAAASALRSSRRMRRLVQDLLLLARADAGRAAPHAPVDLAEVVKEVAAELQPVVAGIAELRVDVPDGPVVVSGARDELHRLALNLMENAVKHTPDGCPVAATVHLDDGRVCLVVEDNGPGVPPAMRERVFERFVRGEGDRSGSSGLGLAIVAAVAESHGGRVRLDDTAPGTGARFVVDLPALAPAPTAV